MTAEKIPSWIERLLMPKLSEIGGDIKAINTRIDALESNMGTRIDSLEDRIDSLETNLNIKIDSLRNETKMEISSLRTEMTVRLDSLEKRIPVIEEITALKLKIADIEKRIAVA
jgi:hypothetical protein